MSIVTLNQKQKRIELSSFEIENEMVFDFFNRLSAEDRDEKLFRALYIGCLALLEDRLSAFFSKTANELGTQLEHLKIIFDLKKELFFKSAAKGMVAEVEIADALRSYLEKRSIKDIVALTGDVAGSLKRNKTGDILVTMSDGSKERTVGIECKFDKSVKLGSIESRALTGNKYDTALSQLLETGVNRNCDSSMIVFDRSLVDAGVEKFAEHVRFVPNFGFICIVDSQKGDYSNLFIAYELCRDLVMAQRQVKFDSSLLDLLIKKMIRDVTTVLNVKRLVEASIQNNKEILCELDKSLLSVEFNKKYLDRFLAFGDLSKEDLLEFYSEDEVRQRFKSIKEEIELLC